MTTPKTVLLQGVTEDSHLDAVNYLLSIPNPDRVMLSVAFMNEGGLSLIHETLTPVAEKTTIVAGIRNGITSAQGLRRSLETGCSTYAVDTGSRSILFHPKVYLSRNANEARIIVGSANLTAGGLNSNIEASLMLTMELDDPEDAALLQELEGKIDGMISEYDQHVLPVSDEAMIESLLDAGRVIDESSLPGPTTSGSSIQRELDTVPRINLKTRQIVRPRIKRYGRASSLTPTPQTLAGAAMPVDERLTLVWQSRPLTRRHLTIPTGARTHSTGSMLFGKGALDDIDQRHYFRDVVFANLDWHHDEAPGREHMERAEGRFQFVIRDVNYAVFILRLSHNSRTDTRAYAQRNSMTQLHWGDARRLVAHEDLLDRTMYLYRSEVEDGLFVLEID